MMRCCAQRLRPLARRRRGITLVELLVVMVLFGALMSMVAIYVVPTFQDNKNVIRGMDRVTTALLIAKQRSLRDQGARGLRFIVNPSLPGTVCTELQYVEQPSDLSQGSATGAAGASTIDILNADLTGGNATVTDYLVQPGDFFRLDTTSPSTGYYISNVVYSPTPAPAKSTLSLTQTPLRTITQAFGPTTQFRIVRQPRPLTGEASVNLPQGVVIDLGYMNTLAASYQVPTRTVGSGAGAVTYYEVLFNPGGGVMDRDGRPIVLWVRTDDAVPASQDPNVNQLLVIYSGTGMVAAHPINPGAAGAGVLAFALDGKSSGM